MHDLKSDQTSNEILKLTQVELATLKALAATKKKWWRDYPFLISVMAFVLSLCTSIISAYTNYRKDIHDQQSELANTVRTIQELTVKQLEIREKYKGTPDEGAGSLINNQIHNAIIAASEIALSLGRNATTPTVLPLSQRLYNYGEYPRAERLAELALDAARSIEDEAGALRWLGSVKIRNGTTSGRLQGEQFFARAVTIDQRYDLARSPGLAAWLKVAAEFEWANSLAALSCDDARLHFSQAVKLLNGSTRPNDYERMRLRAQQQMTGGISGNRSCMPAQDTMKVD